ncbi:MAG: OmpA family protein [Pseudoxanthomonas sp.]
MPRHTLWLALGLFGALGALGACQRDTSPPHAPSSSAQAQAEAQAQTHDAPVRPGAAVASRDAEERDPQTSELQPLIERAGGQLRARDILVTLEPDALFEGDHADLRIDAVGQRLRPLAELANRTEGQLQITVQVATRGDQTAALELSKRRADAVADFLQSQGVGPARLHTAAMGAGHSGRGSVEVVLPRPTH